MKRIYYHLLTIFLFLTITSCESIVGGEINQNPNEPASAEIGTLLPAIQVNLTDICGGEFSRTSNVLVQQVEWAGGLSGSLNNYTGLVPDHFNPVWINMYENILNEIKVAKTIGTENGYWHYLGILQVLEAYTLMVATDVWDDIPYFNALQGPGELNPVYDRQDELYEAIYTMLDEAIVLFSGPAGDRSPGQDDVMYGGDTGRWTKAAHAIRARGLLHEKEYGGALAEAAQSFSGSSDNMGYRYPGGAHAAPWFRFNDFRTGDIRMHPQMRNLMNALNDSGRLGRIDELFDPAHPYLTADFFQELITYCESRFIIAEADVRNTAGGTVVGHTAYLAGIRASFNRLGLDESTYNVYVSQTEVDPGVDNLTLEQVMTQKYIALFLQPEAYSDWRRTGIPVLTPVLGDAIPVRWPYPEVEHRLNENAPAEVDIFEDRVGWNR